MYGEIVRALLRGQILVMLLCTLIFLILPIAYYIYAERKEKKIKRKKNKHKKSWKQFISETPTGRALVPVIVGVVFFCICFGTNLYRCISLHQDLVSENYATYTGEFECDVVRGKSSTTTWVVWTSEDGVVETIRYTHQIDKFQEHGEKLKEGDYHGTLVYSPTGKYLLWWDAERIED